MKIGVMLPVFETSVAPAIEFATEAESLGVEGIFAYDHLWPMGHPGLPAISLFPLLGAVAASTTSISIGSLVARIGLEPDEVMVSAFETLGALAPGRVIAGLGTGDQKSDPEGFAYGVVSSSAKDRRSSMARVARTLKASGIEVWIGGGGPVTNRLAFDLGCPLNLWAGEIDRLAPLSREGEVTWGGQLPSATSSAMTKLVALSQAGATWAVLSWQKGLDELMDVVWQSGVRQA